MWSFRYVTLIFFFITVSIVKFFRFSTTVNEIHPATDGKRLINQHRCSVKMSNVLSINGPGASPKQITDHIQSRQSRAKTKLNEIKTCSFAIFCYFPVCWRKQINVRSKVFVSVKCCAIELNVTLELRLAEVINH